MQSQRHIKHDLFIALACVSKMKQHFVFEHSDAIHELTCNQYANEINQNDALVH